MARVVAVKADGVERHGLLAPRVIGGVEDLHAVLVEDGEDVALAVGENKKTIHNYTLR